MHKPADRQRSYTANGLLDFSCDLFVKPRSEVVITLTAGFVIQVAAAGLCRIVISSFVVTVTTCHSLLKDLRPILCIASMLFAASSRSTLFDMGIRTRHSLPPPLWLIAPAPVGDALLFLAVNSPSDLAADAWNLPIPDCGNCSATWIEFFRASSSLYDSCTADVAPKRLPEMSSSSDRKS